MFFVAMGGAELFMFDKLYARVAPGEFFGKQWKDLITTKEIVPEEGDLLPIE